MRLYVPVLISIFILFLLNNSNFSADILQQTS
nr:MAG TPA: hypothetical protein [Caudoviricetes sp.]